MIIKSTEITICISNMDRRVLYQLFKKPSVDLFDMHKNANGAAKTKSFIIMYLNAKLINRPNDEIESVLVRIPSKEKILKLFEEGEFKLEIIDSKETSTLKMSCPNSQKNVLIWDVPSSNKLHISNEEFIANAAKIVRKKNCCGYSTSVPLNLEVIKRTQ